MRFTDEQAELLRTITPCHVKDGGIFEAEILAPPEHGAQKILFQGERAIAVIIAEALNARALEEQDGGHADR
jgi:hypothetical protein